MHLPNLSALKIRCTQTINVINVLELPQGDRLRKVISTIEEADDDLNTNFPAIVASITELEDLAEEELVTIAHHINNRGIKPLVYEFLSTCVGALSPSELRRNATHRWWMRRWDFPEMPFLNLEMDQEGFVVVDLWHTRRGNLGPTSFKEFRCTYPTFFFGSYGLVKDNLDCVRQYVEEEEDGENNNLYVKRGRFKFKPLLWFDDKHIEELRNDRLKSDIVARLVNSHPALQQKPFDLRQQNDTEWKKMLYYGYEVVDRRKFSMPFRLDNNCVDEAAIPLQGGYQGTLAVDVSGIGGATLPPGSVHPDSHSVVIWDVPNTLVEEDEWVVLYE